MESKNKMIVATVGKGMTYAVKRDMVKTYLMSKNIIVTDTKNELKNHK